MFKNRYVLILYDNDKAGKQGAEDAHNRLVCTTQCELIDSPLGKGKDLSDWVRDRPSMVVEFLAEVVNRSKLRMKYEKPNICPCCGQILEEHK